MQPERARHHVRNHDVPLDLVDEDEEHGDPERAPDRVDDERVDHRRHGREPRPDVRDHLDDARSRARRAARTARRPGTSPSTPSSHMPDAGARADDRSRGAAGRARSRRAPTRCGSVSGSGPRRAGTAGRSSPPASACRGACRSRSTMIRTSEKRRITTEIAAPCAKRDASCVYPEMSLGRGSRASRRPVRGSGSARGRGRRARLEPVEIPLRAGMPVRPSSSVT